MTLRTKGEQKAYLDGFEVCAESIEKYLSGEGKRQLECLLSALRNAIEVEDTESEPDFPQAKDIEPAVKRFADTIDIFDRMLEEKEDEE